ncbi:hypothetical protein RIF29_09977 [Crotalaria pallida]|uniref:F-box protein n=1 Tax=Crotalaria pallida TaxID=3830 RepID=A0AAN9FSB4_CROPI
MGAFLSLLYNTYMKHRVGLDRQASEGLKDMEKKMVYLHDDLITCFLLRLPIRSLLHLRCVSKSWFSLIFYPKFAIWHLELAAAPTHRLLYLPTHVYASQTISIDLDAPSFRIRNASTPLNTSFLPPDSFTDIRGSCNGLVLLSVGYSNLFLWNPTSSFHKSLPLSPIVESNNHNLNFTFLYGFVHDASTDDYLVLLGSNDFVSSSLEIFFEFFSLRTNVRNKIEGTHLPYILKNPRTGTLLNGIIHWFVCHNDTRVNVILAFDVKERDFSEMPLPIDFNISDNVNFCDLCVLKGFLSLYNRSDDLTVEIWMLQEYKVHSSWTKAIVVHTDNLHKICFSPICSTKSGDIVGKTICSTKSDDTDGNKKNNEEMLVKYNAEGQLLEQRSYHDNQHEFNVVMYTESLLSFPVVCNQAVEDERHINEA